MKEITAGKLFLFSIYLFLCLCYRLLLAPNANWHFDESDQMFARFWCFILPINVTLAYVQVAGWLKCKFICLQHTPFHSKAAMASIMHIHWTLLHCTARTFRTLKNLCNALTQRWRRWRPHHCWIDEIYACHGSEEYSLYSTRHLPWNCVSTLSIEFVSRMTARRLFENQSLINTNQYI